MKTTVLDPVFSNERHWNHPGLAFQETLPKYFRFLDFSTMLTVLELVEAIGEGDTVRQPNHCLAGAVGVHSVTIGVSQATFVCGNRSSDCLT